MPGVDTSLIRSLPVMLALLDGEGRFLDATDEWERRLGYSRDELRNMRPEELATAASAQRIREEHMPRFRRTGRLASSIPRL